MMELKNNDIQSLCLLPVEKDFQYNLFNYTFEKYTIVANQNINLIKLIWDEKFNNLEYIEEKREIQLVLEESTSDFDLLYKCNKRLYDISNNISHTFGLYSLNSSDSYYDDKINFDNVKITLKYGSGDPLNAFFQSTYNFRQLLYRGINEWQLFNFKNEKVLSIGHISFKHVKSNKRIKEIYLNSTINVKFPELKEYLIACDNKMKLSMSAILRFLVVHIAKEMCGRDKIKTLEYPDKYKGYDELINLIASECKNIESNDKKFIKSAIKIASKILHGKTEATQIELNKIQIGFICLLKYINHNIDTTYKNLLIAINQLKLKQQK